MHKRTQDVLDNFIMQNVTGELVMTTSVKLKKICVYLLICCECHFVLWNWSMHHVFWSVAKLKRMNKKMWLTPLLCFFQKCPLWCSGNMLASYLWGWQFEPETLCGKIGSCLLLVDSLQYRTLTNCMYWFPLPIQLPIVIWPVQCWKWSKTPTI